MMKDTKIEEIFARYQPNMGDSSTYMENISKKLAEVEYIKRYREAQVRRNRRIMIGVFAAGVFTGAICIALVLTHAFRLNFPTPPSGIFHFDFNLLLNAGLLIGLCFISLSFIGLIAQWIGLKNPVS